MNYAPLRGNVSILFFGYLHCFECGKLSEEHQGSTRAIAAEAARRKGAEQGWRNINRHDYCPGCVGQWCTTCNKPHWRPCTTETGLEL